MQKITPVGIALLFVTCLLPEISSGQQHSVYQALGLTNFHAGMREFRYIKPSDPHLTRIRKLLQNNRPGYTLWPMDPIPSFQRLFTISSGKLDSLTLATPHRSGNVRPFLVFGKSGKLAIKQRPPAEYSPVSFGESRYYRWKNDSCFASIDQDSFLHGTESDVRVCMGTPIHPVMDDSIPPWKAFADPAVFLLELMPANNFVKTRATGVRFANDGFEIRQVVAYRDDIELEFIQQQSTQIAKGFAKSPAVSGHDPLRPDQYSYETKIIRHSVLNTIRLKSISTVDEWRQAMRALLSELQPFGVMQLNYRDISLAQKNMLSTHSQLLGGIPNERERKRAVQRLMTDLEQISKSMSSDGVDTIENVFVETQDPNIAQQIRGQLQRGFSKPSLILNDRIAAAGDALQRPPSDEILKFYLLYGDEESSAAACRIVGREKIVSLVEPLEEILRSQDRGDVLRAAAGQSLRRLGKPVSVALDWSLAPTPKPIQLPFPSDGSATSTPESNVASKPLANKSQAKKDAVTTAVVPQSPPVTNKAMPSQFSAAPVPPFAAPVPPFAAPNPPFAARVPRAGRNVRREVSDTQKIKQYLSVLRDPNPKELSHQAALHYLAALEPQSAFRDQIFSVVPPFAKHSTVTLYVNALTVLDRYGFKAEDDELIVQIYPHQPHAVAKIMAQHPTEKIVLFLTEQAKAATTINDPVFRTVELVGSKAEIAVWPALENNSLSMQSLAMRALGNVGTQQSIEKLQSMPSLPKTLVEFTIKKIQSRLSGKN